MLYLGEEHALLGTWGEEEDRHPPPELCGRGSIVEYPDKLSIRWIASTAVPAKDNIDTDTQSIERNGPMLSSNLLLNTLYT